METLQYSQIKYDKMVVYPDCRELIGSFSDLLETESSQSMEIISQMLERVEKVKNYLRSVQNKYKTILIVSHGTFIFNITQEMFGRGVSLNNGQSKSYTFQI